MDILEDCGENSFHPLSSCPDPAVTCRDCVRARAGRCGRRRKKRPKDKQYTPQEHLAFFVAMQRWIAAGRRCSTEHHKNSLELTQFPETGRGLRTRKRIQPGDRIISIPASYLVTPEVVLHSAIGSVIKREKEVFSPQQLLTMFLVIQRFEGSRSPWSLYLDSLPETYSTPVYFTRQEMSFLRRQAKEVAEISRQRFIRACEQIMRFVQKKAPAYTSAFSPAVMKWAWSTVDTRSVYVVTKAHPLLHLCPDESNVALAPYLDMLNHSDTSQVSAGLNPKTNCYEIITHDSYKKNEQVFISYGAHDNTKLMVNYGFCLTSNRNNSFKFTLDELASVCDLKLWNKKKSLIQESKLEMNLLCSMEGVCWALLTALKICMLQWDEMLSWRLGDSVSLHVEEAAQDAALQLISKALDHTRSHLQMLELQAPSTHWHLTRSLAVDDLEILEHCCLELRAKTSALQMKLRDSVQDR